MKKSKRLKKMDLSKLGTSVKLDKKSKTANSKSPRSNRESPLAKRQKKMDFSKMGTSVRLDKNSKTPKSPSSKRESQLAKGISPKTRPKSKPVTNVVKAEPATASTAKFTSKAVKAISAQAAPKSSTKRLSRAPSSTPAIGIFARIGASDLFVGLVL